MPTFGTTSTLKLNTSHYRLQVLFEHIVKYYDCTILYGHRGEEAQNRLFSEKKSKVQWPDSEHNSNPSRAVDVAPWPIPENWGDLSRNDAPARDLEWKERVKFYEFAGIVKFVAKQMGIRVRWGGDWDGDGAYTDQSFDDLLHWELLG